VVYEYSPDPGKENGASLVIFPGGAFDPAVLVSSGMPKEGTPAAELFCATGFRCFIVRYRCGSSNRHPVPWEDGKRAVRTARHKADENSIDPNRIGVLGFSAGGHVASMVAVHSDNADASASDEIDRIRSNPDFVVLIYPVITMRSDYTHGQTRTNLLGQNPSAADIDFCSTQDHVTEETPPTFVSYSNGDSFVNTENSRMFYAACADAGAAARIFVDTPTSQGLAQCWMGHGHGVYGRWPEEFMDWADSQGLLNAVVTSKPHMSQTVLQHRAPTTGPEEVWLFAPDGRALPIDCAPGVGIVVRKAEGVCSKQFLGF
jgi:hypothetical protein